MKLYILGSAGWMPSEGRQTSCFMVESSGRLIILDAGTGISNIGRYKSLTDKYDTIDVVFSHYHLDHIIGLSYIYNFFTDKRLNLYMPQKSYSRSPEEILNGIFSGEASALNVKNFSSEVNVIGYTDDFYIGSIPVKIIEQEHSSPSFGIRIGSLTYLTDTLTREDGFAFAADSSVLLHECWYIFKNGGMKHSSLEEIAPLCARYKIGRTLLIHLNPNIPRAEYKGALLKLPPSESKIEIADDFQEFEL